MLQRETGCLFDQRSQGFGQRTRILIKIDKDEAAPRLASHRDETAVRFNQTIEIMRLRHGQKRAIEPITPRMIRADEEQRITLRLIQNGRRAMANRPEEQTSE